MEGGRELAEVGPQTPACGGRQREQPGMQALILQCVLDQEVGQRFGAQGRQTVAEPAPRWSTGSFAELRGMREPREAERNAVLAEEAVSADRARAGAEELPARC